MHDVNSGQTDAKDDNETDAYKDITRNKPSEGTNKTQPEPDPLAKPSDVPGGGKFIEPSPFTR